MFTNVTSQVTHQFMGLWATSARVMCCQQCACRGIVQIPGQDGTICHPGGIILFVVVRPSHGPNKYVL